MIWTVLVALIVFVYAVLKVGFWWGQRATRLESNGMELRMLTMDFALPYAFQNTEGMQRAVENAVRELTPVLCREADVRDLGFLDMRQRRKYRLHLYVALRKRVTVEQTGKVEP